MRSHTPPRCQSRTRRQHVIPDPQPSSCGSICQGMPLRRTNKMPMRHARSETRGRPPFGRRGGVGKNGSTRSHNGSGSSAAAIPVHATSPTRIAFRRFCYALLRKRLLHELPNSSQGTPPTHWTTKCDRTRLRIPSPWELKNAVAPRAPQVLSPIPVVLHDRVVNPAGRTLPRQGRINYMAVRASVRRHSGVAGLPRVLCP